MKPEREELWKKWLAEALVRKNIAKELFSRYETLCVDLHAFCNFRVKNAKRLTAKELQRAIDAIVAGVCEHERLTNSYLNEKRSEEEAEIARRVEKEKSESRIQAIHKEVEENTQAIAYLLKRGKAIGVDFNTGNAVQLANDIAFYEYIESILGQAPFDFNGKNCDDCSGWDGGSRRCNCGNRRVEWARGEFHSFRNPDVRAEAY